MRRFWTTGELARLREWRAAGVPLADCAARLGRTYAAADCFARRHRLTTRGNWRLAGRGAEAEALAASGLTHVAAAARMGVPDSTLCYWSRRWGLRWGRGRRTA
jgi:hypothetical protein